MFSDDNHIESVRQLLSRVRQYVSTRIEGARYDLVSRLVVLASALALAVILLAGGALVLAFLSYAVVVAISPAVGGRAMASLLMALFYVAVMLGVYALRRRLIVQPMANLLGRLFLDDKTDEEEPS